MGKIFFKCNIKTNDKDETLETELTFKIWPYKFYLGT